jgi:putative flippase GtrA
MVRLVDGLYDRVRHLIPELAKFGVVGGIGAVIDLGGAAVLYHHVGPLKAKAISITAATIVTYFGSRFWTFRHRENQPLLREGILFVALNVVGLLIAEAVIGCTTYVLGYKDPIAYNMASLVGTGLGTIFRYFAYRKWVFLAPADQPAAQPVPAAADFPAYTPWDPTPWEAAQWEPAERRQAPWEPARREPARRGPAEWEPMPWEPAEEPVNSRVPIHESGQVRLPTRVRPARATTGPIVMGATTWSAGPAWPASAAGTGPRPAPAGSRGPGGRHRKPQHP